MKYLVDHLTKTIHHRQYARDRCGFSSTPVENREFTDSESYIETLSTQEGYLICAYCLSTQMTENQGQLALYKLDGRKYKQINDQFSHDAGDTVIKEMGKRLQACIRSGDRSARLDSDEMGVIMEK